MGSVSGETVDWWALGVICYESDCFKDLCIARLLIDAAFRFLYGIPPFHAETPDMVFENILSRNIDWYEDQVEVSPEARDFIERLLCMNPEQRLGAGGSQEVRTHPFLAGVVWNNLLSQDAVFVPRVTDPESTDYFDARGATDQVFDDEEVSPEKPASTEGKVQDPKVLSSLPALLRRDPLQKVASDPASVLTTSQPAAASSDDFGTFSFKNVEVLKQANQDLIRKLRSEQQQAEPDDSQLRQHTVRSGSFSFKVRALLPSFEASENRTHH